MSLREIEADDMDSIFDIRVRTWHNPNGAEELEQLGITHDSVRELLRSSHRGWIASEAGVDVGFAMGNRETGEMWVIAVLPEYENQGFGRALLTAAEDWLFAEGWDEIWLTTDADENYRAVGFYRRLGWEDWKMEDGDRFMKKRSRV